MRPSLALSALAGAVLFVSPLKAQTVSPATDSPVQSAVVGSMPTPVAQPAADALQGEKKAVEPGDQATEAAKPKPIPPSLIAKINLSNQRMEVLVDGQSKHTWAISSGRTGFASPRGTFRVSWTSKMWYSRKYDMAPMPHAVFFKDGVAVHGTTSVGMLGRPASHGCIRLAPANAAAFYALVQKHGNIRTQIQVFGTAGGDQIADKRTPKQPLQRVAQRQPEPIASKVVPRVAPRLAEPIQPSVQRPRPIHVASRTPQPSYFPPGSPYYGRPAFVHNGMVYVKIR